MKQAIPDNKFKKNPFVVLVFFTSLGIGCGLFVSDASHNLSLGFGALAICCMFGLAIYLYQSRKDLK